ncbi:MAG: isoprenyl transferase [Candidatus Cloacimonadota bacterium]|nr:isoprenyl transferase [Candidatus Cloacimonadota bacterium]
MENVENISKEELIEDVKKGNIPEHVAIIMDGNGRWAKQHNLPRIKGHMEGVETVRRILNTAGHLEIKHLTLYAFSTENWRRPQKEANFVINLIQNTLMKEIEELNKNNVIVHFIGSTKGLGKSFQNKIKRAYEITKNNTGLNLILAVNYGGRNEIIEALNRILEEKIDKITETEFSKYLYTNKFPDPELILRTSGEIRLSNFLTWQSAYSEFWFTETLWPDFSSEEFLTAIIDFQNRQRRFGGIKKQTWL